MQFIPLMDGEAPFHLEPADVAIEIEDNALRHLAEGQPGLLARLVPALEREAIVRLAHAMGEKKPSFSDMEDAGLARWQVRAWRFARDSQDHPESTGWASAQVLLRARDLREAVQAGESEKAAALAMLLVAWVFVGGIGVKYATAAPVAERHIAAQRKRAKKERAAVKTDEGSVRKRDLVQDALKQAGEGAGTSDVWPHLWATLDRLHMNPNETGAKAEREIYARDANGKGVQFTFKGVQTMLRRIRGQAASRRGRPAKKPR